MNLEDLYKQNLKTMNPKDAARAAIKQGNAHMATLEEWEKAGMRRQFTAMMQKLDGRYQKPNHGAKVCDNPSYSVAC